MLGNMMGNTIKKLHMITMLLLSQRPSFLGVVVGNYKMSEDDPDEVNSKSTQTKASGNVGRL